MVYTCPSCHVGEMEIFHQLKSVPANSCILLSSSEEAINYPKGEIRLAFCYECGFVSNVAFEEKLTEYSGRYEETQSYSGTFQEFHKELAHRLIKKYNLHEKQVIEIGCGKGEFLILLCEIGGNRGIGFDPGYIENRIESPALQHITFIQDFYSEKYSSYQGDFVCCKMTLEHIHPTAEFISTIRRSIGDRSETIVFFQIPEATRILRDCAFEDIYYEHCSYFTPGSLGRLFRRCGFEVFNLSTEYDDQYLTIEARPATYPVDTQTALPQEEDMPILKEYVAEFPKQLQIKRQLWHSRLASFAAQGKKIVLWGSGSKGVSFLTTLDVGKMIEYVVDINPFRKGFYMSGTGQQIVAPDFLKAYRPDVVVIMNPIYRKEISNTLRQLGLSPELFIL